MVNKFRGDVELLRPGLDTLTERTGRPVLGVLPWLDGVWIDSEDALAVAGWRGQAAPRPVGRTLRVAVVRFPRVSNATDVDALALEPGVVVEVTADPDVVAAGDIAVLPGSRSTATDLAWLRERGLADAVVARARAGRPVLGICGGYQMLARTIEDDVESGVGRGARSGPAADRGAVRAGQGARPADRVLAGHATSPPTRSTTASRTSCASADDVEPFLDGWRRGSVWGTTWHGAFENDAFRRAWLRPRRRCRRGCAGRRPAHRVSWPVREQMIDRLADAVEEHLDTDAIWRLIEDGVA